MTGHVLYRRLAKGENQRGSVPGIGQDPDGYRSRQLIVECLEKCLSQNTKVQKWQSYYCKMLFSHQFWRQKWNRILILNTLLI
jgi:hypothetical protein